MEISHLDLAVEADHELLRSIREGVALLDFRVPGTARGVRSAWSLRHDDRGRALIRVELTRGEDRTHAVRWRDEIADSRDVGDWLLLPLGRLLSEETTRMLDRMKAEPLAVEGS